MFTLTYAENFVEHLRGQLAAILAIGTRYPNLDLELKHFESHIE